MGQMGQMVPASPAHSNMSGYAGDNSGVSLDTTELSARTSYQQFALAHAYCNKTTQACADRTRVLH